MSSSRRLMKRLYLVMAGQFGHIEAVLKVQGSVDEFPIHFGSLGNPGLAVFIIHGSKGLSYYWIGHGG